MISHRPIFHSNMKKQCMDVRVNDSSSSMHRISMYSCSYFYQKAFRAMSVIHIQSGQNPMNRITLNVNDEVPVAT